MRRLEKRMRQCLVALRELAVNISFITREILSRKQNDREKISMHVLPFTLDIVSAWKKRQQWETF